MALRCCCLCPVMVTDDWLGRRGPARRPSKGRTSLRVHTHKHLHKTPLHWWPMWLQVIVSSQDVVLVVILNDHSKRGVLTICPFTGKMIPLYRLAPLLPRPPYMNASTNTRAGTVRILVCLKLWEHHKGTKNWMWIYIIIDRLCKTKTDIMVDNKDCTSFIYFLFGLKWHPEWWKQGKQFLTCSCVAQSHAEGQVSSFFYSQAASRQSAGFSLCFFEFPQPVLVTLYH